MNKRYFVFWLFTRGKNKIMTKNAIIGCGDGNWCWSVEASGSLNVLNNSYLAASAAVGIQRRRRRRSDVTDRLLGVRRRLNKACEVIKVNNSQRNGRVDTNCVIAH